METSSNCFMMFDGLNVVCDLPQRASASTDLPSNESIGSFLPALTSTSLGQNLSAFALLPATSLAHSPAAPLVCCTMSWPSTIDQISGLAGRTLPTLAA